uniref:Uncharacterized protein n=1 Tax=Daphnia galeata TaxID=27404 RepID=A0A8J2WIH3_9CRUS|nr:unnamed protein product [Daphnia galeata]
MYKSMSLLVLVALTACVVSMETQDQETAEQYFRIHGVYPSWYPYGVRAYPYTGYPAATAYTGYYPSSYYPNSAIGFNRFPNSPYAGSRGWFDPDMYPYNFYNYNAIPYLGPQPAPAPAPAPAPSTGRR